MRQGLNIGGYLRRLLLQFAYTARDFRRIGRVSLELFELDSQHCETLTDVVVKLSARSGYVPALVPQSTCGSHDATAD